MLWGKLLKHGETGNIKLLRLARKDTGTWHGKVHEQWVIEGKTDTFENYLIHFRIKRWRIFWPKLISILLFGLKNCFESNEKSSIFKIIFYPKAKFIQNYYFPVGFLDGLEGLVQAILMSFHSFLGQS